MAQDAGASGDTNGEQAQLAEAAEHLQASEEHTDKARAAVEELRGTTHDVEAGPERGAGEVAEPGPPSEGAAERAAEPKA